MRIGKRILQLSFVGCNQAIEQHVFDNACKYSNRWEKYDAKGWTEKGAHKYGRLNEQSWWEKWGEHYDGSGSVLKWYFSPFLFHYAFILVSKQGCYSSLKL